MKLLGFYNLNKTTHRTVPVKNILYLRENNVEPKKYFIRIKGVSEKIEIEQEDYVNALSAMEYS
jgi:hypothetical protein